jgi:membrane protease YdiL (CAAX protease family)
LDKKAINIYDFLYSIIIYLIIFAFIILLGNIFYNKTTIELVGIVFDKQSLPAVFYIVILVSIIIYIKIRKLRLKSFNLDFSNKHLLHKGLFIGLVISGFVSLFFIARFLILDGGVQIVQYTFTEYLLNGVYILIFVSFVEEFLFRSYFQTMFNKVIKYEVMSVMIVGFMFSLIHVVALTSTTSFGTLGEFLQLRMMNLLSLFCMHCLFYFITKKYKNILPVVLIHFVWNFVLFILS